MSSFGFAGGDFAPVEPVIETPVVVEESTSAFYVGLGISALSTGTGKIDFFDNHEGRDRTGNLLVLAGYEFNEYIAVEGRYSTYIFDEDSINSDTWGIYVKPQYPVNEDINVYALVGLGGTTIDGIDGNNIDFDDNDFQWGLGLSHDFSADFLKDMAVFIDYTSIANGISGTWNGTSEDVDSDAITVGVTYKF